VTARIARAEKDKMRAQTEEILAMHKNLVEKIEFYASQTEVEEYNAFWQDLIKNNQRLMSQISRYMVMKCNR
jgi:hypothetical protein